MTNPIAHELANWEAMKAKLLAEMPELAEDEQTLLDTLEGLTELHEQLTEIIRSANKDAAFADATNTQMQRLRDRKAALVQRAERKKQVCLHYMEMAGLKRIDAPDMTVTRKAVPPGVQITDAETIPDNFCRFKREPNKTAIKAALKEGWDVPGATLTNGGETIQVKI